MHKTFGISGGVGPMGSIKSKTVTIPIPRSKKAYILHRTGFLIKAAFLIIAILAIKLDFIRDTGIVGKTIIAVSILLAGGAATLILYRLNKTRSKFFHSKNYFLVKKYKNNGYKRGFHPMISTTPVGLIAWVLRLLF